METLYLHLPAHPGEAYRLVSRQADGVLQRLPDCVDGNALTELAASHPHAHVVALAPASACLLTGITMTARQLKQAGTALAYALEEAVAEDVEALHIVQCPHQPNDWVPLLLVSHARMQAWLEPVRAAGWTLDALVPDLLLVPEPPPIVDATENSPAQVVWKLGVSDGTALLRTSPWQGAGMEVEAVETLLDAALAEAGERLPSHLQVVGATIAEVDVISRWAGRQASVIEVIPEGALPPRPGADVLSRHAFNLLQGPYAERRRGGWFAPYRVAAAVLAAAFIIQLCDNWVHYFYYHSRAGKAQAEAVAIYKRLFPDETRIVNLRTQFDNHLQGSSSGNTAMMQVLTQVASGMQGTSLQTQSLEFDGDNHVLNLDIDAQSLNDLDSLKQKLLQQGLTAELSSANAQGSGVRGRLKITLGAA